MNIDEIIKATAEKYAMAEGDVREIYEEKLQESEDAGKKGEEAKQFALKRMANAFRRKDQSSAVKVEGYFFGAGDRYDAVRYERERAIESYQENPQEAIKEGIVAVACPPDETGHLTGGGVVEIGQKNGWSIISHENNEQLLQYNFAQRSATGEVDTTDDGEVGVEDGWRIYPLDTQRKFNSGDDNPSFGLPIDKHQWTRRGVGIFRYEGDDTVQRGSITLRGKASTIEPPLFDAVQFMARVNEADDGDFLFINSTDDTEITPNPELDSQVSKTPDQLIESYYEGTDQLHDLQSLYEYMAEQDGRRTVIVKADILHMDLEPNDNNTLRLVISDMDFVGTEMVEWESTVWLPAWQEKYIDFAVDSRVYVVGSAQLRDAYAPEGETTDEKEVVINGQGIYADPTTKIPREDGGEDLEEDDFDFEPDGEETDEPDDFGDDW